MYVYVCRYFLDGLDFTSWYIYLMVESFQVYAHFANTLRSLPGRITAGGSGMGRRGRAVGGTLGDCVISTCLFPRASLLSSCPLCVYIMCVFPIGALRLFDTHTPRYAMSPTKDTRY